jgi:acyl-CoA synthetase (AMP-forming)/AMP-acid ligase II
MDMVKTSSGQLRHRRHAQRRRRGPEFTDTTVSARVNAVAILPDHLRTVAGRFPDRPALRVAGPSVSDDGSGEGSFVEMSYAEWDRRSNAVARGLVAAGVQRGDRVALFVGNDNAALYQVGYFAVLKAGAVAVPINPRVARRELEHMVGDSGATAVVAGGGELERVRALPPLRSGGALLVVAPGAAERGELDWDGLVNGDTSDFQAEIAADDIADILYTSGTTGLPKGVAATHRSALVSHPLMPIDKPIRLLHSIPLATFLGTHGTQTLCLRLAVTNLLLPSFDAPRFAHLIDSERPAWIVMVPAHALLLIESGLLDHIDTSSVRMLIYGSAPMPHHAVQELSRTFPRATLMNGYGLTEGGTSVVTMPPGEALKRPGSVGRPVEHDVVRVLDAAGDVVTAGTVGEVAIKVAAGERFYHNDPEATAATWRGDWVQSGDLGYFDNDGFLYLVDRKKDVIVRGGYNVSSIEVESALHEHPDVVEAAVLGVPHAILGQDVAAVVRLRGGGTLDVVEAAEFLADRVADYKRPRRIVVCDGPLPRTPMGKLDKAALREMLVL